MLEHGKTSADRRVDAKPRSVPGHISEPDLERAAVVVVAAAAAVVVVHVAADGVGGSGVASVRRVKRGGTKEHTHTHTQRERERRRREEEEKKIDGLTLHLS